jgi:hypothetical protein
MPMSIGKSKSFDLNLPDEVGLQIMIVGAEESEAKKLDEALYLLLAEYGYDMLLGRSEFRGTWFIRYKSSSNTKGVEKDFELFLGSDPKNPTPPATRLPPEHREKWKKLKEFLETTKAYIIVGTMLVGTLGAIYEFNDAVHKQFGETHTLSRPAPQSEKQLQKIPLPPLLIRIDAQKKTRQFEKVLNASVEKHLVSQGLLKKKSQTS